MSTENVYFDDLYRSSSDPWGFRERWYEQRKRELILASLTKPLYMRAFEPGCSNAEISYSLACRTEELVCCDTSFRAVELARQKMEGFRHVTVMQARLPEDWPDNTFDLILISELGYYLDSEDFLKLIECARHSLATGGEVLACHWRPPIEGCPMTGDQVHDLLHRYLGLNSILRHEEGTFLLEVWSADKRSVAEREGLTRGNACSVF